jgi:hypothetical protein
VHVDHPTNGKSCCPECQAELACYDHAEKHRWRHMDSCRLETILIAHIPRVKCPETMSIKRRSGGFRNLETLRLRSSAAGASAFTHGVIDEGQSMFEKHSPCLLSPLGRTLALRNILCLWIVRTATVPVSSADVPGVLAWSTKRLTAASAGSKTDCA